MFMYYLTITDERTGKEKLVAVAGEESEANYLLGNIDGAIETNIRTVNQLFNCNVEIPDTMKWLVESDRKYQERLVEDRMRGLLEPEPKS